MGKTQSISGLVGFALAATCAAPTALADAPPAGGERDHALTVYAGTLSGDDWFETLSSGGDEVDSHIAVIALSKTLQRAPNQDWTIEVEGQVAKHWRLQDNWEFNLLLAGRWQRFPWNDRVATSVAFGLGPSYASATPEAEILINGESRQWLIHWYLELELGLPRADWSAILRLQHRSTGFGLLGDDGGYNAPSLGIKYHF